MALVSCEEKDLPQQLKDILISKYRHLFHHLIKKIERKIKKIERRKKSIEDRRRRVEEVAAPPHLIPFFPPPPPPFGLPFLPPPFVGHHGSFHFFKPHPRFQIFKKIQSFSDSSESKGPHGFVNITKAFPGDDGKIQVIHIEKEFIPREIKEEPVAEEATPKEEVESPEPIFSNVPQEEEKKLEVQEEPHVDNSISDRDEESDTKLQQAEPHVFGPFIIPLNDIDESKPFNPIPTLISGILQKIRENPQLHIKRVVIKKLKDDEPERKLKGTEEEVHELTDQVIKNGQGQELLDFLKQEVQKGTEKEPTEKKEKRKLNQHGQNPFAFDPTQMVREILDSMP